MTDTSTPPDDDFTDVFGDLPDPRAAQPGADGAPGGQPASRREARAAAQGSDGEPGSAAAQGPDAGQSGARQRTPSETTVDGARPAPRAEAPRAAGDAASALTLDELLAADAESVAGVDGSGQAGRRRSGKGKWIALGIVVALLAGIGGAGVWAWSTYEPQIRKVLGWQEPTDFEPGLASGEAIVEISEDDNGLAISRTLAAAGVIKTPDALYELLLKMPEQPVFYPGVYTLQTRMTAAAALAALQDPASRSEASTLVREGLTVAQTLPILAEDLGIPLAELEAAVADPSAYSIKADSLEGWLFPARYTFNPGVTATEVVQAMIDRAVTSLNNAGVAVEDRQRILTIASIVQREARFSDDFFKVSRVIENRLQPGNTETFGLLQMDSTAQYGYGEMHDGSVSSSGAALRDPNPWNTYVHPGLPIGPIANPGDLAIEAAAHPVDGPWYYFVTVNLNTGETVFTTTAAEHEAARKQWIQWCRENPDAGC
ncbi:MAG: endolytic transglycosylase MltG [Microbacteriaceae bacterium]|nr:endolytic transglycosylase MltG [Microbacteriaceae bacterium]